MSLLDALLLDPHRINIWIAQRTDGLHGSGTQNDPYDGSTAARLDAILNGLGANTRIQFGPGTFQINGYQDGGTGGWLKAAMKIVGSGIDVTTLQLVGATAPNTHYFAIGHPFTSGGRPNLMDSLEISELTIDCNLAGAATGSACGAVRVLGNFARASRLKVINWGKKEGAPDCFVIAMITADPPSGVTGVIATGIEECVAMTPGNGDEGPITVFHVGPKDDTGTNAEGCGPGPYIRNCFLDFGWPTATAECRGLSMAWCKGGVVEGNQVHNTKYGGPVVSKSSACDLVVRNNLYKNVAKGPFWNLATLPATSLSSLVRDSDPTLAVATTRNAHGLTAGDRVSIGVAGAPSAYAGIVVVKDVPNPTTFCYELRANPAANAINPTLQKVFGMGKLVVEANTIELATGTNGLIAIHLDDAGLSLQAPDFAHGEVIIRDNTIRYVDGAFEPGYTGYGIQVNGARNLQVRNNVVEAAPANPVRNIRCGSVKYFNNKSSAGELIQGVDEGKSNKRYDELETDAEDALVLALLSRR
jgi:hypothetical protein